MHIAQFSMITYTHRPAGSLRICVTGAGGFIASHLAKRLKSEGHYIIACDWKRNEYFKVRLCACWGGKECSAVCVCLCACGQTD